MWNFLPSLLGNIQRPEPKEYIEPAQRPSGGGLAGILSSLPQVLAGMTGGNLLGEAKAGFGHAARGDVSKALPTLFGSMMLPFLGGGGFGQSPFSNAMKINQGSPIGPTLGGGVGINTAAQRTPIGGGLGGLINFLLPKLFGGNSGMMINPPKRKKREDKEDIEYL
tara:strand:- start:496 stop:993 length:498 start_codon:yes stop_codon:yes gene_type:complete